MKHETPEALIETLYNMVGELEDLALRHQTHGEETFIQCTICGEWETHTAECPINTIHHFLAFVAK